jgi:hypothetical protein
LSSCRRSQAHAQAVTAYDPYHDFPSYIGPPAAFSWVSLPDCALGPRPVIPMYPGV